MARGAIRSIGGATSPPAAIATAKGSRIKPVPSASSPSAARSRMLVRSSSAEFTPAATVITANAVPNRALRKSVRSTSGSAIRRWRARNPAIAATPTTPTTGTDASGSTRRWSA